MLPVASHCTGLEKNTNEIISIHVLENGTESGYSLDITLTV